jgi:hypothetical protein
MKQDNLALVIPFTTPELTRAAINAASGLGAGLYLDIRLVKIEVVPYTLDLMRPPVAADFLKEQLRRFPSALPIKREIFFAREFEPGLRGALNENSVVILATRKRPWRTRTERLAAYLRRCGHTVVLVPADTLQVVSHQPLMQQHLPSLWRRPSACAAFERVTNA